MQYGLSNIIASSINNIGRVKDEVYDTNIHAIKLMAEHLIEGIHKIEEMWPDLDKDERQELKATIEFLKATYLIPNEEIVSRTLEK